MASVLLASVGCMGGRPTYQMPEPVPHRTQQAYPSGQGTGGPPTPRQLEEWEVNERCSTNGLLRSEQQLMAWTQQVETSLAAAEMMPGPYSRGAARALRWRLHEAAGDMRSIQTAIAANDKLEAMQQVAPEEADLSRFETLYRYGCGMLMRGMLENPGPSAGKAGMIAEGRSILGQLERELIRFGLTGGRSAK